jgi:hypothetical protein
MKKDLPGGYCVQPDLHQAVADEILRQMGDREPAFDQFQPMRLDAPRVQERTGADVQPHQPMLSGSAVV